MKRVVFVCSGNICRSPMAAAIAKRLLEQAGVPAMVLSAGTLGINGAPASDPAVEVMAERGLDLQGHRSQGVSRTLAQLADHLVVMAPGHEAYLLGLDPKLGPKIHRLWEYADPPGSLAEIADPINKDKAAYFRCAEDLTACLARWTKRVAALR